MSKQNLIKLTVLILIFWRLVSLTQSLKELFQRSYDYEILEKAFDEDIQEIPYEVLFFRIRNFLQQTLPHVLSQEWKTLDWHVDSSTLIT